ncbi:MAG: RHS repeat-associated core domain-containing protein, partial [Ktedonobacteraceae bacterium]
MADGREVAEVDLSNTGSTVSETVSYILTDHLGSVDDVQGSTSAAGGRKPRAALVMTGGVKTDMSFGAFGNRREPTTWLPPVPQAETQTDHNSDRYGFTHQEMLDNVNLIHMNGRVYDPNLGRFLSVDPVFEFPTNTQSLNPYSYVLNNPLSMTDPTGYAAAACPNGSSTACPDELKAG